jgi:hypothetical protein
MEVGGGEDEPVGESILYQIPQIFSVLKHAYLNYNYPTRREGYADLMNRELRISLILLRGKVERIGCKSANSLLNSPILFCV